MKYDGKVAWKLVFSQQSIADRLRYKLGNIKVELFGMVRRYLEDHATGKTRQWFNEVPALLDHIVLISRKELFNSRGGKAMVETNVYGEATEANAKKRKIGDKDTWGDLMEEGPSMKRSGTFMTDLHQHDSGTELPLCTCHVKCPLHGSHAGGAPPLAERTTPRPSQSSDHGAIWWSINLYGHNDSLVPRTSNLRRGELAVKAQEAIWKGIPQAAHESTDPAGSVAFKQGTAEFAVKAQRPTSSSMPQAEQPINSPVPTGFDLPTGELATDSFWQDVALPWQVPDGFMEALPFSEPHTPHEMDGQSKGTQPVPETSTLTAAESSSIMPQNTDKAYVSEVFNLSTNKPPAVSSWNNRGYFSQILNSMSESPTHLETHAPLDSTSFPLPSAQHKSMPSANAIPITAKSCDTRVTSWPSQPIDLHESTPSSSSLNPDSSSKSPGSASLAGWNTMSYKHSQSDFDWLEDLGA